MLATKILLLSLAPMILMQSSWRKYIDLELEKLLSHQSQHEANMAQSLASFHRARIACPVLDPDSSGESAAPCGILVITAPGGTGQMVHILRTWTIIAPSGFWIEVRLMSLDIPWRGAMCNDAALVLRNLLGRPTDVSYCGRRPGETLHAKLELILVLRIPRLDFELQVHLQHELVSEKNFLYVSRAPVVFPTQCWDANCGLIQGNVVLLRNLPVYTYDPENLLLKYTLFLPTLSDWHSLRVEVMAGDCGYIVYDGPGVKARVLGRSSSHGANYTVVSFSSLYLELVGTQIDCEKSEISTVALVIGGLAEAVETHSNIADSPSRPVLCHNSNHSFWASTKQIEFVVNGSAHENTWCRLIYMGVPAISISFHMQFNGPDQLVVYEGASTCQFGGMYIFSHSQYQAICESVVVAPDTMYVRGLKTILVRFFSGYSSGHVAVTLSTVDEGTLLAGVEDFRCTEGVCQLNGKIWQGDIVEVVEGIVSPGSNRLRCHVRHPPRYPMRVMRDAGVAHIGLHVTIGSKINSLGHVRFQLHVTCSARSRCESSYIIGAKETSTFSHYGSVSVDRRIDLTNYVDVRIALTPGEGDSVGVKLVMEKVQECDFSTNPLTSKLLPLTGCNTIVIANGLQGAHLIIQSGQLLRIGLSPDCAAKHCVKLNVTSVMPGLVRLDWTQTALQYANVTIRQPGHVSLKWRNQASSSCPVSEFHLRCPVVVTVEHLHLSEPLLEGLTKPFGPDNLDEDLGNFTYTRQMNHLVVKFSPHHSYMIYYDTSRYWSWSSAAKKCRSAGASLTTWRSLDYMDRRFSSFINQHMIAITFLFLGLSAQVSGLRWTEGAPLVQHDTWAIPDVLHVDPKISPAPLLNALPTKDAMHPILQAGTNRSCVVAMQDSMEFVNFERFAWYTVACDAKYMAALTCEKIHSRLRFSAPYCMGHAYLLGEYCVVHLDLTLYDATGIDCKSVPRPWHQIPHGNSTADTDYLAMLCDLFEELCNVTASHHRMAPYVPDWRHVCLLAAPELKCPARSFRCAEFCIPASKRCNNVIDCVGGEDESDCGICDESLSLGCQMDCKWPHCKCPGEYFQCESGGCVPAGSVCDFEDNCADGSDELYCGELLCPEQQRPCADGRMCVPATKWFDGIEDCSDASDETVEGLLCPGYVCPEQACIPFNWLNDGIPDCQGAADEEDFMFQKALGNIEWPCEDSRTLPCRGSTKKCYPVSERCVYQSRGNVIHTCRNGGHLVDCETNPCNGRFKCPGAYCLPFSSVCDGVMDCKDGADEHPCPLYSCPGLFRCSAEESCIHPADVCDGHVHCKLSLDDEKYCPLNSLTAPLKAGQDTHGHLTTALFNPVYTRVLNWQRLGIQQLDSNAVLRDSLVIVLHLEHNAIQVVPTLSFSGYPRLRFLFLAHNKIERLLAFAFQSLSGLRVLDLSHNRLVTLPVSALGELVSISSLDVSHNPLKSIEEAFVARLLGSLEVVYQTDAALCCMVGPRVRCGLEQQQPPCHELLLAPVFTYAIAALAAFHLAPNVLSIVLQMIEHKNLLLLNLALVDALFAVHLFILAASDLLYRHRFSFYVYTWPESVPCFFSMLAFVLSFQQSLLSLLLVMCHTCTIIGSPFEKSLHRRIVHVGLGVMWLIPVTGLALLALGASEWGVRVSARNQLCQTPSLHPLSLDRALKVTLLAVYSVSLIALIAVAACIVFLVRRSIRHMGGTVHGKRTDVKVRVARKCVTVTAVNVCALTSVLVTEGMVHAGWHVEMKTCLLLSITIMSLNKLCNPWFYSLTTLQSKLHAK